MRESRAIARASFTSALSQRQSIAQPTIRRLKRSSCVDRVLQRLLQGRAARPHGSTQWKSILRALRSELPITRSSSVGRHGAEVKFAVCDGSLDQVRALTALPG